VRLETEAEARRSAALNDVDPNGFNVWKGQEWKHCIAEDGSLWYFLNERGLCVRKPTQRHTQTVWDNQYIVNHCNNNTLYIW
jgi:hypothetical protein